MLPEDLLPAFRDTLLGGSYNLLLGSGILCDSHNGRGELLRSAEDLRRDLCRVTGARDTTSLTRAYALLTPQQIRAELVDSFSKCTPGPSVLGVPRFLWRRLFTFNVDDVLEKLYLLPGKKQTLVSLNYDSAFEPTPERQELQVVHLHGWVLRPDTGFVFSASEYVRVMRTMNPWMHLLSEILATEPFIIAGTSLNEIDLEYYLSFRNPATPRRGRGPSLLIEPTPDVATRSDCERYGLILVPATFGNFMHWLCEKFPSAPSISELLVPDTTGLFSERLSPVELLRFFSDFELVAAADRPLSSAPSPFLYGREPEWDDLHQHVDVERHDNATVRDLVAQSFAGAGHPRLTLLLDDAGTGKTTIVKRVAHDLARLGKPVLTIRALSRIDTENAIKCLSQATTPILLAADGLADHAEQVIELLEAAPLVTGLAVIGAERSYRQEYLDLIFGDTLRVVHQLLPLKLDECQQLMERYRQFGLIGDKRAINQTREFAKRLQGEPVAVAVCHILNDFRPLDAIIESLWAAAKAEDRLPYLCVALAQHCYSVGLRYSLLQAIMGPQNPIGRLLGNVPLRIAVHAVQDEFVVAINAIIAERILWRSSRRETQTLQAAFHRIASALASYVNRKAIMRRSPEARLAGRLFDADKIVRPLLDTAAEDFYVSIQKHWEWNSRYWEQRALLVADANLTIALQYARHAVAIERHPFPLTTLGKLLLRRMELKPEERVASFDEAFEILSNAIESEAIRSRVTVHPFTTLFAGAASYLELGGILMINQRNTLSGYSTEARYRFPGDPHVEAAQRRLDSLMF